MKILGIAGSARKETQSGVYQLVETVLKNTDCEYELISLNGKKIGGCIACLQCVGDNVCKVEDDMAALRDKVVAADAYVVGAPNYYGTMNALTHSFLERWYQFRHQEGDLLWGKLGVAVGVGGVMAGPPVADIERFFMSSFIETVETVTGQGAASCYTCGYGETCKVGVPVMVHGEGIKITPETTPDVTDQPEVMQKAADAGKLLGARLRSGHDRQQVTQRMMKKMMALFSETT